MFVRVTSAFHLFTLLLHLSSLINFNYCQKIGKTLYIYEDPHDSKEQRFSFTDKNDFDIEDETFVARSRRETSDHKNSSQTLPNITTQKDIMGDTHQQVRVFSVGKRSDVIICLARDDSSSNQVDSSTPARPSAVYISYDHGGTFENKTEAFTFAKDEKSRTEYATLDIFHHHPKFNNYFVFVDKANSLIFISKDYGRTVDKVKCPFYLSEISFDEDHPDTFVVLDKIDPFRQLWMTRDSGKNWFVIEDNVKEFFLSNSQPKKLFIESAESSGLSTVVEMDSIMGAKWQKNKEILIQNVIDFQVRGDYKFATMKEEKNQTTESDNLSLWVSFKNQKFIMAEFNNDLDRKNYYIADVSNDRIFVVIAHNQNKANLYVSEVIDNQLGKFELSLKDIFAYFPNTTWKDSWLKKIGEAFIDLYKVEGLQGIYIASKVNIPPKRRSIHPENLISVITHDHGVTWNQLKPPETNYEGFNISCGNCSLHLRQKFSHLHPVTKSVSIVSSKSAPGIIMATGILGSSLEGYPALYVSRDAGLSWKQVVRGDYLFDIGDHGGILVGVKYFQSREGTCNLTYSIDQGQTWNTYRFNKDILRVHGLEKPSEKTAVFTLFVSKPGQHIFSTKKVNLRNVFERDCKDDDYEFWSPSSTDQSVIPCVLGRRKTYRRRLPTANCYTGTDYDRSVKFETCLCDFNDYECDIGFVKNGLPFRCIRDTAYENYDPYEIPATCYPGNFYNRTKGYRKISNNNCVGGLSRSFEPDEIPCPIGKPSEFLLVAQMKIISKFDLTTHSPEILPLHNLEDITAIEYELKNDCLYWADSHRKTIGRNCLRNGTSYPEILVEFDSSYIEGMALDWISNVLYFVDGKKARIQIIRTDISSHERMQKTILGPDNLQKPKSIAVHPMMGYIFWTDWALQNASVSRANLDGTNIKRLFTEGTVEFPIGITIDYISDRIYWVDANKKYIGSSDYDGRRFKKVLHDNARVNYPFAITVFKDKMYWDDWKNLMIFVADKEHGDGITMISETLTALRGIKIVAHSIQSGTNKCENNTVCSHICLGTPNNSFVCLCPDGMEMISGNCMCPGGILPHPNSTCPQVTTTCAPTEFSCNNAIECIPEFFRCDGTNDCDDNSDEFFCEEETCSPNEFQCDIDRCIPESSVCDFKNDCLDGKDEMNCTCKESMFQCDNGNCIPLISVCDLNDDCGDRSDEQNCIEINLQSTCESDEIYCFNDDICISKKWQCDGESDCKDGSDEEKYHCQSHNCQDWLFSCDSNQNSSTCISKSLLCDGVFDCSDESDEAHCEK